MLAPLSRTTDTYLSNQFVLGRHTIYQDAANRLVASLSRLLPNHTFSSITFGEEASEPMGSKLLLGRQSNLHLASHVILAKFNSETENASPHPVVHILDTGATFNVVRYEKYGRGALLDFSPHNLMSGRFERKIKELAIAIEEFTKAQ